MSAEPYPPDPDLLDAVLRHLSRIDINLDELEVEAEAALPRTSDRLGERAQKVTRTLRLADHAALESAVRAVVRAVHDIFRTPDAGHDAHRCDRCVKSDCCSFEFILVTRDEAARILGFLGEPADALPRHFVEARDVGEYFDLHIRHERGHCRFLKKVGKQMRCSIYPVRPQVCREFDAGACTMWSEMLPV
jgi:Fe-S-cluster containining protein